MGRPVILGNGGLTVGLNEQGLVHDFYYPYVGLENLTNARSLPHKIGIWVDNTFSWVDNTWDCNVSFSEDALVSDIRLTNKELNILIKTEDTVDFAHDTFMRKITVKNLADHHREIRLFMHQAFVISRSGRSDTALYVPDEHYILDYKGQCSLLINGQTQDGTGFDQYAVGNFNAQGGTGTYIDAEDGELSGSAVEHGQVDSVIRFTLQIPSNEESCVYYWVAAADSQPEVEKANALIKTKTPKHRFDATKQHWHQWIAKSSNKLHQIDSTYLPLVKKSMMLIKAHMDKHGGVIASCDSSIYNYGKDYYSYVWPRDGAFAIWPLIRLGYTSEPKQFFNFCNDILHKDGYLRHKYQPDKAIGSTWHPLVHGDRAELAIQEDETAIVVYMLGEYLHYSGDNSFVASMYDSFAAPAADFMARFIDNETGLPHASYDLWEEKFLTHTYTVSITYQALLTAVSFAKRFGSEQQSERWQAAADRMLDASDQLYSDDRNAYTKGFLFGGPDSQMQYDNTIDISTLYGVAMFGLFKDARKVHSTLQLIESELLDQSPSGGSPRYENDSYFASEPQYQGNPWFVTTLWLAQYYSRAHKFDKAYEILNWTVANALPSGVLSEQINPVNSRPMSVTPLVWSHAEFINTVLDVTKARK